MILKAKNLAYMEKKTGLMEPFLLWAVKTITMRVKKQ